MILGKYCTAGSHQSVAGIQDPRHPRRKMFEELLSFRLPMRIEICRHQIVNIPNTYHKSTMDMAEKAEVPDGVFVLTDHDTLKSQDTVDFAHVVKILHQARIQNPRLSVPFLGFRLLFFCPRSLPCLFKVSRTSTHSSFLPNLQSRCPTQVSVEGVSPLPATAACELC